MLDREGGRRIDVSDKNFARKNQKNNARGEVRATHRRGHGREADGGGACRLRGDCIDRRREESDARGDGCFERGPLYAWAVTMSVVSSLLYLLYLVQSARVLWVIRERTDGRLLASRQASPVFLVTLCGAFGIFPHVSRLVAHAAHLHGRCLGQG